MEVDHKNLKVEDDLKNCKLKTTSKIQILKMTSKWNRTSKVSKCLSFVFIFKPAELSPWKKNAFQSVNRLPIDRDAYKVMAQSETDIKRLQGEEDRMVRRDR